VPRSIKVAGVVSLVMALLLYAAIERGGVLRARRVLLALPRTARAALTIHTGTLERTAAAKTLLDAFVAPEQLSNIEAVCGLAPLTALSEITVWVRGPEEQPFQSIGLMLKGRTVDAATLAQCHRSLVEARGGSVVRLEGSARPVLASRDLRSAIALLDERTIVTGSVMTVTEALAVRQGTAPALIERPTIARMWPRVSKGAGIAAVLDPPEHWKSALQRVVKIGEEASAMEGLEAIALSVRSGSRQAVDLYLEVANAKLALRDAELIDAWKESPPDGLEPPWKDLLRSARVRAEGRTIVVTVDVSSVPSLR
jgi:hypothetical protein